MGKFQTVILSYNLLSTYFRSITILLVICLTSAIRLKLLPRCGGRELVFIAHKTEQIIMKRQHSASVYTPCLYLSATRAVYCLLYKQQIDKSGAVPINIKDNLQLCSGWSFDLNFVSL